MISTTRQKKHPQTFLFVAAPQLTTHAPIKAALLAVALGATAVARVQACCDAEWAGIGDGDNAALAFQRDLHVNQAGVLTPAQSDAYLQCRAQFYDAVVAAYPGHQASVDAKFPEWIPYTHGGKCNIFGCHCNHCYGADNCQGTNDGNAADQHNRWALAVGDQIWHTTYDHPVVTRCDALRDWTIPGFTGTCPTRRRRLASIECSDRDRVLDAPLRQTAAALSRVFCADANATVGLTFAGSVLESLDADQNGAVSCLEWNIAREQPSAEQLNGYYGIPKLAPPACKLSSAGKARLASYNAYLAKLTAATLATNATGALKVKAEREAAMAENSVVGSAGAAAVLEAKAKAEAAWNKTMMAG